MVRSFADRSFQLLGPRPFGRRGAGREPRRRRRGLPPLTQRRAVFFRTLSARTDLNWPSRTSFLTFSLTFFF